MAEPDDILALADGLVDTANTLHARILAGLEAGTLDQARTEGLFREEGALRQGAQALYAEAAIRVVAGLELAQADLLGVVAAARDRLQAMEDIGRALDLAGNLVRLATSVLEGRPASVRDALKGVREGLQALEAR